jgi:hypothetical protein
VLPLVLMGKSNTVYRLPIRETKKKENWVTHLS